jgi:dihydroorotase/N-acyl-D-amino-acid deacylase
MRRRILTAIGTLAPSVLAVIFAAAAMGSWMKQAVRRDDESISYDILIRNGHVIDGTGSPWYAADIGIRDGHIAAIGNFSHAKAKQQIDAAGRVVAPGFIDMLGQSELTMLVNPHVPSKIFQGITTEITGEGASVGPQNDVTLPYFNPQLEHYGISPGWHTFTEYFARLQKQGMGINLGTYVGATQIRAYVIGMVDRAATPKELEKMKELVAEAMQEGALGISSSLMYPPATYSSTEELIALASVSAQYGGIYASHIRDQADNEMAALEEVARIAREAHTPTEIFHLQVAGKANWGKMQQVVAFVEKARSEGLDITADTYAYTAGANNLGSYLPPWAVDGGYNKAIERLKDPSARARIRKEIGTPSSTWENEWLEVAGPKDILIVGVRNPDLASLDGKTIADVAKLWNEDPIDTMLDLIIKDKFIGNIAFYMSEEDVKLALKQPWVSIGNDEAGTSPTGILSKEHPHPRAYGTFPRILAKFVRDEKLLTLPEAIRKFSAQPAQRMKLTDRGVLKQGMWADVVVFDLEKVRDLATYAEPNQLSVGMDFVLVNGVAVIADGKMTNALPGKVLYGPGHSGRQ